MSKLCATDCILSGYASMLFTHSHVERKPRARSSEGSVWLDTVITQQVLHQRTLMENIYPDMFTVAVGEVQRSPILVHIAGQCIHDEGDTTEPPFHNETDIISSCS